MAGLRYSGLTAPQVIDGPMTRQIFEPHVGTLYPVTQHTDPKIAQDTN
jgi:hypothetical protein